MEVCIVPLFFWLLYTAEKKEQSAFWVSHLLYKTYQAVPRSLCHQQDLESLQSFSSMDTKQDVRAGRDEDAL